MLHEQAVVPSTTIGLTLEVPGRAVPAPKRRLSVLGARRHWRTSSERRHRLTAPRDSNSSHDAVSIRRDEREHHHRVEERVRGSGEEEGFEDG